MFLNVGKVIVAAAAWLATNISQRWHTKGQFVVALGTGRCRGMLSPKPPAQQQFIRLLTGVVGEPNITAVGGFVHS
jgi:hypothetical protein